jgi:hypothetical protein
MRSCWSCGWRKEDDPTTSDEVDLINPPTLIGTCYAYIKERGGPMEIQATKRQDGKYVADTGCKKWTGEKQDFMALRGAKVIEEEL